MAGLYDIAAARGRIVGQGLLGMGHIASRGIESRRKAKTEEEERRELKKARQFTKTLSIVNLYTKMGDDLTPENRMKLYTGALIPMLAKVGGLPEGTKQEDVSKFIGSLAANSKEAMQGFREDNDKLLELVNDGKCKEADKFLSGMMIEYGKLPGAKSFLDHAKTLLKDEKAYSRGKKEKEAESKAEIDKTVAGWQAEGKVKEVPKTGLLSGLEDKGTTFEYGGRQLYREEEKEEIPTEQITIYGPEGATKRVSIQKGQSYTPPEGWSLSKPGEAGKPIKDKQSARKRISQIEKDYVNFKTKGVNAKGLKLLSPDAQALISAFRGQKLSPDDLDYVRKIYDKEINALIDTYGLTEYTKNKSISWKDYK